MSFNPRHTQNHQHKNTQLNQSINQHTCFSASASLSRAASARRASSPPVSSRTRSASVVCVRSQYRARKHTDPHIRTPPTNPHKTPRTELGHHLPHRRQRALRLLRPPRQHRRARQRLLAFGHQPLGLGGLGVLGRFGVF